MQYWSVVVKEELSHKGEALDLPIDLCSHPHLQSWALGSDKKNEIANKVANVSFLSRVAGMPSHCRGPLPDSG